MDVHEVYQRYREYDEVPNSEVIANVIEYGNSKTLDFIAMLYSQKGRKMNMDDVFASKKDKERLLLNIEHMFTTSVMNQSCISEKLLEAFPRVRLHATSVHTNKTNVAQFSSQDGLRSGQTTPRQGPLTPDKTLNIPTLKLSKSTCAPVHFVDFCDDAMAKYSQPRIRILSDYLNATVSVEWVRACASMVSGDDSIYYKLASMKSDRHHHIVNRDIKAFVKAIYMPVPEEKVITWQFSREGKCIHIGMLQDALNKLCPGRPAHLAVFACAIGLPTRGFMDTVNILKKWRSGRFKIFDSISPMIKIFFRDTFDIKILHPNVETTQLLEAYAENSNIFQLPSSDHIHDIDRYICNVFYTFPTAEECSQLFERLEKNIQRWIS